MSDYRSVGRAIAVLILVTIVFGTIGESWIPRQIVVANDPAATARNITGHNVLYRLGFAAYLVEAICDAALAMLFYVLLRDTGRTLALITVPLGILSTAMHAVAESFYFGSSLLLTGDYFTVFSTDQRNALVMLAMKMMTRVAYSFFVFYGLAAAIRGFLMFRSRNVPRVIGAVACAALFAGPASGGRSR